MAESLLIALNSFHFELIVIVSVLCSFQCMFYCFEIAHFIHFLESNYKLRAHEYKVVSLDMMLFKFIAAAGVLETPPHFQYVASRHAFDFCAELKTKDFSLIKVLLSLHVLPCCELNCRKATQIKKIFKVFRKMP